ncbi:MAG TPA: isopentenyl-diphosphate Delta-isomerase [Candidatus Saccharimonadia bacterium]|nr:isopentenyl-diphosphate Delta-isomerase [Candidatus Saccharimonadia bacterium]
MEMIVLVDERGREIGTAPKLASHHAHTPLHRAFSCYVFDETGRFLVTQRAASKKVWPGVWTNSVCGHPAPGEGFEDAIRRRAEYELGLAVSDIRVMLPDYRYMTPPFNGIIENEICPVFVARTDGQPAPNPEEVGDYAWLRWDEYGAAVAGADYSYWARDQYDQLMASSEFTAFLRSIER